MSATSSPKRARDVRLDFFRGAAMFIIFVAHVPDNSWDQYIPARFGFSSAAELFVFCSGCASALAFGSVFLRRGWPLGAARILQRIWQVYWAHIGLFLVLAAVSIVATRWHLGNRDYVADLSLGLLAKDGASAVLGLLSLTYDPDLLNILPMYIVLLAMVPLVMALAAVSRYLVFAFVGGLWLIVQVTHLDLPAGGDAGRQWFFDPFAWQLVFFTGFSFVIGFVPVPRFNHAVLFPLSLAFVLIAVPINFWVFTDHIVILRQIRDFLVPNGIIATTEMHVLRYVHFLALAYVSLSLVALRPDVLSLPVFRPIVLVGQQALATFMASLALAWIAGILLDIVGRSGTTLALANLLGFGWIVLVARGVAWFKSAPWTRPPVRLSESAREAAPALKPL